MKAGISFYFIRKNALTAYFWGPVWTDCGNITTKHLKRE